ncbi:MAG: peroxide stress protein YaaA [Nakamurella sp.]
MFVLLPPSETKAPGGNGPALDLRTLVFPELAALREQVLTTLVDVCADPLSARRALGVAASKDSDIVATARLRTAPTMPAMARYTGVLYEALDIGSLPRSARFRAADRLLITSALFGFLAGGDSVPAYRLSAGSTLPGLGGLAGFWRPQLAAAVTQLPGPVVDLRSGAYASFVAIPEAITVRVVTENQAGGRTVVSHFNKATKGLLARALVLSRAEFSGVTDVARVARRAGLRVERTGERSLQIVT